MQNCKLVQSIAADAGTKVGIDPISIITIISSLLPTIANLFSSCKKPTPPAPTPSPTPPKAGPGGMAPADYRELVDNAYEPDSDSYDPSTFNPVVRHTLQEVRQHWKQKGRNGDRPKRDAAETIAKSSLDGIRNADDATLQEAIDAM